MDKLIYMIVLCSYFHFAASIRKPDLDNLIRYRPQKNVFIKSFNQIIV